VQHGRFAMLAPDHCITDGKRAGDAAFKSKVNLVGVPLKKHRPPLPTPRNRETKRFQNCADIRSEFFPKFFDWQHASPTLQRILRNQFAFSDLT
jgi:hypothetical protein